ncbi:MAG: hypothetical protein DLM57_00290 [Pseudonocardiales bacterium]|nr:MAG: hypothetical protein DLM57_00290 [Pseudonocardiales bacterium]
MNDDSAPPLPQNETAVAYSTRNALVAVAAANDYVSGGVVVMRTTDGGAHWASTRVVPEFRPTGDFCNGGDPAVAYSRRDRAFYMSQLCFFRELGHSEVQVYVSKDDGKTWTPGRQAARAASTYDYATKTEDTTNFNDKEYIAVDNTPTSPHYGRLYVTYTKFHVQADGFSDYCPIQLAYSDNVPATNPFLATFVHTAVNPDAPGGDGKGPSANQFSVPRVEKNGALDISYIQEDCNTSIDFHLLFQKSTDGGSTFLPTQVTVEKPGQWADNPDTGDNLPPTAFRAPETESLAYSPTTGTLTYVVANSITKPTTGTDISYWLSHDGGLTWSDAHTLSSATHIAPGPAARNDQFMPWVDATPSGKLYAIWFDRRADPANHDINTWQAESTDDGQHWTTHRISTKSWNPDRGFFTSGAFIGDYNGLAANDSAVYPVWTDGRNSSIDQTGIGETDIFTNVEIQ